MSAEHEHKALVTARSHRTSELKTDGLNLEQMVASLTPNTHVKIRGAQI